MIPLFLCFLNRYTTRIISKPCSIKHSCRVSRLTTCNLMCSLFADYAGCGRVASAGSQSTLLRGASPWAMTGTPPVCGVRSAARCSTQAHTPRSGTCSAAAVDCELFFSAQGGPLLPCPLLCGTFRSKTVWTRVHHRKPQVRPK